MKGLRRIPTLRRVIMVTSMTKLSVRAILELTRPPTVPSWGDPFIPIRAVVVDTVPTSSQFEVVIRLERRSILKLYNEYLPVETNRVSGKFVKNVFKKSNAKANSTSKENTISTKNPGESTKRATSSKKHLPSSKPNKKKSSEESSHSGSKKFVKNPFYEKTHGKSWRDNRYSRSSRSPEDAKLPRQNERRERSLEYRKRQEVIEVRCNSPKESHKRRRDWDNDNSSARDSSLPREKKSRDNDDDLRMKLSNNRNEPDLLQKMKEQQKLLEVAKTKLTGVDSCAARQLQDMLTLAIEQTNQIQSQLPRSVWDRIAPPDHTTSDLIKKHDPVLIGRYVKELDTQDIVITTPNKGFEQPLRQPADFRKYQNATILEPNIIPPLDNYKSVSHHYESKPHQKPQQQGNSWNRDKNRWGSHKHGSQSRNHDDRSSNQRGHSPQRRPLSPPRRHFSPPRQTFEPIYSHEIEIRRQVTPPLRRFSPLPRPVSPPRHHNSPRREMIPRPQLQVQVSPPRPSPTNRPSPPRFPDDWDIPSRGAIEQHSNWQRTINNRPQDRWDFHTQSEKFHKGNNLELNWEAKPSVSNNWNVGDGSGDAWNNKLIPITAIVKEPWSQPLPDNRFAGPSNDKWNTRAKELNIKPNNSRNNDMWTDNNKPRWEPLQNKNWSQDKEDWDDLPEDARDPWGDDGGAGLKDRWQKLDNPQQINWQRESEQMEWSGPKDNWQNKGSQINTNPIKPWGQNIGNLNHNLPNINMNNPRWTMANDGPKKQLPAGNWPPGGNNSWRQQPNFSGGFQPQRNFNSNNFKDGR